ncbi:MAG: exodeoxyribonuclease VII small subunit [Nitrospinae bacterium]|nr:exodeoxyribonuclease VII small subunit [Nitrospinota bacterium]
MSEKENTGLKFEAAIKRLEEIVTKLEGGDLELENSIALFEEGIRMSRLCQKKLDEAEKKIEKLIRDKEGALATEPMEDPTQDAPI